MFRLHKTKPAKSGERVDFRFSHFKVVQVPKGWDKLFVSVISVETGKTVAKSGKATVKNGNCQWNETVSQSVWISHDHFSSSKETDQQCLLKLVVAMGSTRSSILGEVAVNMATYMTSGDTVPVSLALKKSNNGTSLQVKIQCLTPRTKLSDEESKSTSEVQYAKQELNAMEIKSEESEGKQAKNEVSDPVGDLDSDADKNHDGEKETSLSTSNSDHNYNSAADSMEKESLSSSNNLNVNDHKQIERLDSSVSQTSLPAGSHPEDDQSESSNSSFNSRITYSDNLSQDDPGECARPSVGISGSSKSLLETAEDTIEELQKEAKTWERNARKLMLDFDTLKKEYLEQSKTQASLEIELSAACAECEGLQKEVEQLKLLLERSVAEQVTLKDSALRREGVSHLVQELENEIKFQEESNANLSLQLKRSQDSNAELVAVLQELEETIEKQKSEIETLSCLQPQFDDIDSSVEIISEKNRNLMFQIEELQESEKKLQAQVKELEQALEERNQITQNGSCREHFSTKDKDSCAGMKSVNEGGRDLIREIEELKLKLQELESDCQELTDENLDLLLKLKETKNSNGTIHEHEMRDLEENMRKKLLKEIANDQGLFNKEFENLKVEVEDKIAELSTELNEKKAEIEELEANLLSKENEIRNLESYQQELESKLDVLQKEKNLIQESMANVGRESDISTKCMIDLQKDLTILTHRLDSQVSANKSLERRSLELERAKRDLELHLSDITEENTQLSARNSDLESQLSSLTEETESTRLEQESSKSVSEKLKNEIAQLREETEAREMELREMAKQFSEAQSECEDLRSENQNIQARMENLAEECNSLRRSNGVLKRKNMELQGNCEKLDEKLRESQKNFADCSMKVNILEENIASLLEESDSKGKILASEMDQLIRKTDEQNEKLNLLNKMYSEKNIEIENLQQELRDLSEELSAAKDEKERVASDAVQELSSLEEVISKLESELNAVETECQAKIQDLTDELTISKQNQEILRSDNKRMLKMLANYQSCEDDFKTTLNDLELKLTVSEYERQQLAEESNNLQAQLQKTGNLQDEVEALKNELKAIKNDKSKLQNSSDEVIGECKKLKAEKTLLLEEITTLKKGASELEDCKQDKIALEQKLLQMEHDLMAKDALCEQDAELKKEIGRTRRSNKQLQEQIQQLEEDNQKCKSRVQLLEKELLLTKEEQNKEFKDGVNKNEADPTSKIKSLEDELEKATKANQTLKIQIKRMMSEGRKARIGSPRKPTSEEVVPREKFERTKSSLETELIDLRERYLNMSLKYAQVEAEREELVMKLKATNNSRRWFL